MYVVAGAGFGLFWGSIAGRSVKNTACELGRDSFGMWAFMACLFTGLMCGGLFAFPVSWILAAWVRSMGPATGYEMFGGNSGGTNAPDFGRAFRGRNSPADDPPPGPYTVIGPVIVCNRCRHSGSRGKDGEPPAACASCGYAFVTPEKRRKRHQAVKFGDDDVVELTVAEPRRRR